MDHKRYFAGDPTPRPRLPIWKLVQVPKGGFPVDATLLSTNVYPVHTHFNGEKRVLCGMDYCDPSLHRLPKRWCGYFQALVQGLKFLGVLEVPEDAYVQIKQLTLESPSGFRGLRIRLARRGERRNAPITIDLIEVVRGVKALPEEIDIWPMIMKLFKIE